jgi:Capsular polysaccharide biosynthesis protein
MVEIDLRDLFKTVLRKSWILVICVILFGGATYIWTNYYIKPVYSSYTTLYVGKNVDQYGLQQSDIYLASTLIGDYSEIAKSRQVAYEVAKEMGLPQAYAGSIAGKISVSQRGETRVIQISVSDMNPANAMNIANKVAEVFKKKVVEIMQVENVQIIDKAEKSTFPISPNKKMNYMIGILLGLVLGIGIIILIEFIDNSIKTPEDIEKHLELPVIGTIPVFGYKGGKV